MTEAATGGPRQRLDKWLWQARFFKTRGLSARLVADGHCRVDGERVHKPATQVGPGAVLTFPQASRIRVVRIIALGTRRGPASEAALLYEDLTPEQENDPPAPGFDGKGRPGRRERRNLGLYRDRWLE